MDAASSFDQLGARRRPIARLTPLWLLLALTALAIALRLIDVGARPLWLDEAYSGWFSSLSWHRLWTEVPHYEPHPPFYYSLLKLWRGVAGGSTIALRSLSVLLSVATIPLVFAASRELERQRPSGRPLLSGGLTTFLAAAAPMLVLLGQEARPYPLLIFAYSLATLGLLRLIGEFRSNGAGDWRSWLMLAAGTELGLWAHALGLVYAACLALALAPFWFARPMPRQRLLRGLAAIALVALLYLPCMTMMLSRVGDWGTGWLSWSPIMLLQLIGLYTVAVEVLTIGSAFAALAMILLAKRAIQSAITTKRWNVDRALLLLWFGPPLIAALVSQLGVPIFLPRTLAATLIPFYLLLGAALARVEADRERTILAAALVITLIPSAIQIAMRPPTEPWDQVASFLNRNVKSGDTVWVYPNDSALPLGAAGASVALHGVPGDYPALGWNGPIRAGSPAVVSLTARQAQTFAAASIQRPTGTIWLVSRQSQLFDPHNDVPTALAKVRRPGGLVQWSYIGVRPYYRR